MDEHRAWRNRIAAMNRKKEYERIQDAMFCENDPFGIKDAERKIEAVEKALIRILGILEACKILEERRGNDRENA